MKGETSVDYTGTSRNTCGYGARRQCFECEMRLLYVAMTSNSELAPQHLSTFHLTVVGISDDNRLPICVFSAIGTM